MNGYFDNATTSYPKPSQLGEYITKYIEIGGSYGRTGHKKSYFVSETIEETRNILAKKLGITTPENLTFCGSATEAANTILLGLKYNIGDTILLDSMSHNAIVRPLNYLKVRFNLNIVPIPYKYDGQIDLVGLKEIIDTASLVVINHVSNVNGVVQNLKEIKAAIGNIPILVDASQSVGNIPININECNINYLFFSAHKSLMGPTGVGVLYIKDSDCITPLKYGGTGSYSDSYDMPWFTPDKYEAGTPNVLGIFGLYGVLNHDFISLHSKSDFSSLLVNCKSLDRYEVFCSANDNSQAELFSIRHLHKSNDEVAYNLDKLFDIQVRSGLHCSPLAHRTIGTLPKGTIRISLSKFHSKEDIEFLLYALKNV